MKSPTNAGLLQAGGCLIICQVLITSPMYKESGYRYISTNNTHASNRAFIKHNIIPGIIQ